MTTPYFQDPPNTYEYYLSLGKPLSDLKGKVSKEIIL